LLSDPDWFLFPDPVYPDYLFYARFDPVFLPELVLTGGAIPGLTMKLAEELGLIGPD